MKMGKTLLLLMILISTVFLALASAELVNGPLNVTLINDSFDSLNTTTWNASGWSIFNGTINTSRVGDTLTTKDFDISNAENIYFSFEKKGIKKNDNNAISLLYYDGEFFNKDTFRVSTSETWEEFIKQVQNSAYFVQDFKLKIELDSSSNTFIDNFKLIKECNVLWQNETTWENISCLESDYWNQSENLTFRDSNNCNTSTFSELSYHDNLSECNYLCENFGSDWSTISWTPWINQQCVDSKMNQTRNGTSYDLNECNNTIRYYFNETLVEPNYNNISMESEWENITSCQTNDTQIWKRLTNLSIDSYDCAENLSYHQYNETECDYCLTNRINSSW